MDQSSVNIKLFICVTDDFFVRNPFTIPKYRLIRIIQMEPSNDHITVLFIQLDHTADPIRLFAGDQGTAAATEGVEHDAIRHAGVQNRICQQFHRFHGRVVGVLLGLIELPDGRLFPVGVPLVFALFLPAEQDRLMPPLIWASPQHQRLLLPDAGAGKIEPGVRKRPAKIQSLGVRMEYIDRRIIRHTCFHVLKRSE